MASTKFVDYPEPIEAASTPYKPRAKDNPKLTGLPLVLASRFVSSSASVAAFFFSNSGFGTLKGLPWIKEVPYRFHPTVVPVRSDDDPDMLPLGEELLARNYTSSPSRYYTAADYHAMYKSGEVTPTQVAQKLLSLIKQGQSPKGLYEDAWLDSHGNDHKVIAAAEASTKRYAEGKPLSPLDGVPIGVKDDVEIEGYVSHFGLAHNPSLSSMQPKTHTNWPIAKLQEAGAIIIGRNRMHELGAGTNGLNPYQGTPTNHMNPKYYPGGSTSGGASALGAGIVPICVASDAGGSARIPPAYNGAYGFKTTHSRIMTLGRITTCVIAPVAASPQDLTLAFRIMSQPDPSNPVQSLFAPSRPPALSHNTPRYLGVYKSWWEPADPRVVSVCEKALDWFAKEKGYTVVDISMPHILEGQTAHALLCISELLEMLRDKTRDLKDPLSICNAVNRLELSIGNQTTAADYLAACAVRTVMMRHLSFLFQKYPGLMIMTPTSPLIGWAKNSADESYGLSDADSTIMSMMYVWLANLTGTPSISCPVGYVAPDQGEGHLPIGLMATGEWNEEERLLSWATDAEEYLNTVVEGGRRRAKTWLDVLGEAKGQ